MFNATPKSTYLYVDSSYQPCTKDNAAYEFLLYSFEESPNYYWVSDYDLFKFLTHEEYACLYREIDAIIPAEVKSTGCMCTQNYAYIVSSRKHVINGDVHVLWPVDWIYAAIDNYLKSYNTFKALSAALCQVIHPHNKLYAAEYESNIIYMNGSGDICKAKDAKYYIPIISFADSPTHGWITPDIVFRVLCVYPTDNPLLHHMIQTLDLNSKGWVTEMQNNYNSNVYITGPRNIIISEHNTDLLPVSWVESSLESVQNIPRATWLKSVFEYWRNRC